MNVDELIRAAIVQRRLVQLVYFDKVRIAEPHDYGIHKGVVKLLAYQVGGASSGPLPNWRWFKVEQITEIKLMDRTFAGGRGDASKAHHEWDQVFSRVKPASERGSLMVAPWGWFASNTIDVWAMQRVFSGEGREW